MYIWLEITISFGTIIPLRVAFYFKETKRKYCFSFILSLRMLSYPMLSFHVNVKLLQCYIVLYDIHVDDTKLLADQD